MDSFPIRRGIGLSRTPHAFPISQPFQNLPKPHDQMQRTAHPSITIMNKQLNVPIEFINGRVQNTHERTFSMGAPPSYQQERLPNELPLPKNQGSIQPFLNQNNQQKPPPFSNASINGLNVHNSVQLTHQDKVGN
jgi:hypothetical protein